MIDPISTIRTDDPSLSDDSWDRSDPSAVAHFRQSLAFHEKPPTDTASAPHVAPSLVSRFASMVESAPASPAPAPTSPAPNPSDSAPPIVSRFASMVEAAPAAPAPAPTSPASNPFDSAPSLVSRFASMVESAPASPAPAPTSPAPKPFDSAPPNVSRFASMVESAPAAPAPAPTSRASAPVTRETLAAAASSALAQAAAFSGSGTPVFLDPAFPMFPSSDSPFSTPPSIEAALARPPAAPQPLAGGSGVTPEHFVSPDASAIARFREALAIHEGIQTDFSKSVAALSAAASSALPPATPIVEAPSTPRVIPLAPPLADELAPVRTFTSSDGTVLPYRLYQPSSSDATPVTSTSAPPLVLFLHGAGTRGSDGAALANNISFRSLLGWAQTHEPAIILAPQCPQDSQWVNTPWGDTTHTYTPAPPPHTAAALELLDKTLATLPVDLSRVYVCGNSMGGYATWDILVRRPGLFAAALPMCGGGDPASTAPVCRDVPVWAFHGDADDVVPVENTRSMVDALRADPGRVAEIRYREYPGVSHDCWTSTISNAEVLGWLFAQRRSAPAPTPATAPRETDLVSVASAPDTPAPAPATAPRKSDPVSVASAPDTSAPDDDTATMAAAIQAAALAQSPVAAPAVADVAPVAATAATPAATPDAAVRAAFEPVVAAVAEAIQVSPDLATKGEGEIRIQLKPDTLDGSTVQISVSGADLTVAFLPATPSAAALLQTHIPELAALLAERVPTWRTSVRMAGASRKDTP